VQRWLSFIFRLTHVLVGWDWIFEISAIFSAQERISPFLPKNFFVNSTFTENEFRRRRILPITLSPKWIFVLKSFKVENNRFCLKELSLIDYIITKWHSIQVTWLLTEMGVGGWDTYNLNSTPHTQVHTLTLTLFTEEGNQAVSSLWEVISGLWKSVSDYSIYCLQVIIHFNIAFAMEGSWKSQ